MRTGLIPQVLEALCENGQRVAMAVVANGRAVGERVDVEANDPFRPRSPR